VLGNFYPAFFNKDFDGAAFWNSKEFMCLSRCHKGKKIPFCVDPRNPKSPGAEGGKLGDVTTDSWVQSEAFACLATCLFWLN
jgi:hypothetical protein